MIPEHYRLRIDDKRTIVAVAGEATLRRIAVGLRELGASQIGTSAWCCDADLPITDLAAAVGELLDGEVVYLAAHGMDRLDFGFLVAPNTDGGITVGPN